MKRVNALIVVAAAALGAPEAAADSRRDNFRDIRWAARGNTGVALVNDGSSLFYNPAGLARIKGFGIEALNPWGGTNQNVIGSVSKLATFGSSEQTVSEMLLPFMGKPLALQGSFFPYFHAPGFAAGFWDYLDMNMTYRDPVNPRLESDSRNDWGVVLGGGGAIIPGKLFAGASLRYQKRRALQEDLTAGTVLSVPTSEIMKFFRSGEAFGLNLGLQYVHEFPSKAQFVALGFTWEDVGHTAFRVKTGLPKPPRQAQLMNAGVGFGLTGSSSTFLMLLDVRQLNYTNVDLTKRINLGVELDTLNFVLRGGLHQGYWTAGLSFYVLPILALDIASYGEELDSTAGTRQNRYWLLGLRAGVSLEKGGKAKRKQRYTLDHL